MNGSGDMLLESCSKSEGVMVELVSGLINEEGYVKLR